MALMERTIAELDFRTTDQTLQVHGTRSLDECLGSNINLAQIMRA